LLDDRTTYIQSTYGKYTILSAKSRAIAGLYSINAGTSGGISVDVVFDSSGLLKGSLSLQQTVDLGSALSQLSSSIRLPFDVSDIIVISNPSITIVSSRAAGLLGSTAGEGNPAQPPLVTLGGEKASRDAGLAPLF
jgi:hypothetical protein